MSENGNVLYRTLDHLHRILRVVAGSQSTIAPVYGDSPDLPDVYYVDSGSGADGNDGRDPGAPMATIDAAIGRCTANQGDVILVQPGHSETLAAEITMDIAGVSIIGVGEGTNRPQLTVHFVGDGIAIDAANCRVENIYFNEATAGATADIDINAANAVVKNCHFDLGASDLLGTITVTASGEVPTIEDCTVAVTANGPDEWVLFEGVVDRPLIQGNNVLCSDGTNAFDDSAINFGDTDQAVTNPIVRNNVFLGGGVAATAVGGATNLVGAAIGPNEYRGGATEGAIGDAFIPGLGYRVTKSAARTSGAGADDLFDITGLVLITLLIGEVTVEMAANSDLVLNEKTNSSPLNAITVLDSDVVDTLYVLASDPSLFLCGNVAPVVKVGTTEGLVTGILFNNDTIEATWTEAGTTGTISWTLFYIPLETGAGVVASA